MTGGERRYLEVVDWDRIQYHKALENPPWTRLHQDWLNDYRFSQLTLPQRGVLFCMHMLAARTGNRIPYDLVWISRTLGCKSSSVAKVVLNLTSTGFLREFAEPLEQSKNNGLSFIRSATAAPPDRDREQIEKKKEKETEKPSSSGNKGGSFDDIKAEVLNAARALGTCNADFVWRESKARLTVCKTRKQFDAAWQQLDEAGELPTGRSTADLADEYGLTQGDNETDDQFRKRIVVEQTSRMYPHLAGAREQ